MRASSLVPPVPWTLLALSLVLSPVRALAGCPAGPGDAANTAQRIVAAFESMDGAYLDQGQGTLTAQLACLSAPPTPRQAAQIHLAFALIAFADKDTSSTIARLRAMHEADPTLALSPTTAPPGGPLQRRDAEALSLPSPPRAPHGLPSRVIVDGRAAADLPTARPALVIVLGADGSPLWSGLLSSGERIPALVPAAATVAEEVGKPSPTATPDPALIAEPPESAHSGRPIFVAAGGMAAVTGVLAVMYVPARGRVEAVGELTAGEAEDAAWEDAFGKVLTTDEIHALHNRARGLEIGVQATGGLTLGLVAAGLVWRW